MEKVGDLKIGDKVLIETGYTNWDNSDNEFFCKIAGYDELLNVRTLPISPLFAIFLELYHNPLLVSTTFSYLGIFTLRISVPFDFTTYSLFNVSSSTSLGRFKVPYKSS